MMKICFRDALIVFKHRTVVIEKVHARAPAIKNPGERRPQFHGREHHLIAGESAAAVTAQRRAAAQPRLLVVGYRRVGGLVVELAGQLPLADEQLVAAQVERDRVNFDAAVVEAVALPADTREGGVAGQVGVPARIERQLETVGPELGVEVAVAHVGPERRRRQRDEPDPRGKLRAQLYPVVLHLEVRILPVEKVRGEGQAVVNLAVLELTEVEVDTRADAIYAAQRRREEDTLPHAERVDQCHGRPRGEAVAALLADDRRDHDLAGKRRLLDYHQHQVGIPPGQRAVTNPYLNGSELTAAHQTLFDRGNGSLAERVADLDAGQLDHRGIRRVDIALHADGGDLCLVIGRESNGRNDQQQEKRGANSQRSHFFSLLGGKRNFTLTSETR